MEQCLKSICMLMISMAGFYFGLRIREAVVCLPGPNDFILTTISTAMIAIACFAFWIAGHEALKK